MLHLRTRKVNSVLLCLCWCAAAATHVTVVHVQQQRVCAYHHKYMLCHMVSCP
jgi:hypothetical protein